MATRTPMNWSRIALPLGAIAALGILIVVMVSVPPDASTVRAPMQPEQPAAQSQAPAAPARDRASRAPAARREPAAAGAQPDAKGAPQAIEYSFTSLDGREWSAPALRGKVVFIDFWATWCGPCRATIPELAQLSRAFPDDVVVIGVSKEPAATVTSFLQGNDIPYPCVAGPLPSMPREFRSVRSIPTIFVIDRQGRIASTLVGRHSFSQLSAAFRAAAAPPAPTGS